MSCPSLHLQQTTMWFFEYVSAYVLMHRSLVDDFLRGYIHPWNHVPQDNTRSLNAERDAPTQNQNHHPQPNSHIHSLWTIVFLLLCVRMSSGLLGSSTTKNLHTYLHPSILSLTTCHCRNILATHNANLQILSRE